MSHATLRFATSTKLLSTPYKKVCFLLIAHGAGHIPLCGIFFNSLRILMKYANYYVNYMVYASLLGKSLFVAFGKVSLVFVKYLPLALA